MAERCCPLARALSHAQQHTRTAQVVEGSSGGMGAGAND
jgi:hypothetical protein